MRSKIHLLTYLLFFVSAFYVQAQERTVTGKITLGKFGLNNVQVKAKNSGLEVFSDSLGFYSIVCDNNDKLIFLAKGFFTTKVDLKKIKKNDSVNVNLKLKSGEKNKEVATGYGYIEKEKLAHAIESMENDEDFSGYNNVFDIIKGKFSGVEVSQNYIKIRGQNTFNDDSALLVVDGVVVNISMIKNIPTSQIKSINILKGASASARYGSRGMNGVVLIQTKSAN